ncbi:MAG TPA: AzlC family ABC transporter permease [Streptosporangiaceae bacterium]
MTTSSPTRSTGAVVRDALAVSLAVGVSGVAFGATSTAAGFSVAQTCALSLLVCTGASQFALVGGVASGGNPVAAVAGALLLGARNTFYGVRLAGILRLRPAVRPLAAHLIIDETTAVTLAQPDRRAARVGFTTTAVALFTAWNATTLAGALGAGLIGDTSAYGLDAAVPAAFLALLAPRLAEGRDQRRAGLVAVVIALAATPLLTPGVPVLLALLAVPAVVLAGRRLDRTGDAR